MAYDETLADRIRAAVTTVDGNVTERKMFGGLAFMFNGHMFAGVVGQDLMLRLGEPAASHALNRPHVREMDFTGRPMKAWSSSSPTASTDRRCDSGSLKRQRLRGRFQRRRNAGITHRNLLDQRSRWFELPQALLRSSDLVPGRQKDWSR